MRKLIYYIAISTDGFIAESDGTFGSFPMQGEHMADLFADFPETFPAPARAALNLTGPNKVFDAVIMGKATYDMGASVGLTSPYPQLDQYVVSKSLQKSLDPAVTLIRENPVAAVRELKGREGRAIWLCGGSKLASALYDEIDEVIVKINPLLLGAGIPLFAGKVPPTELRLIERKVYPSGYVRLHSALVR
ncbi:MAG TPA: dihydrofolate reductase family protein [Polyangiales bacterium]|nr:dihydrofolate reductase family protein [Polyangiales bacterium]